MPTLYRPGSEVVITDEQVPVSAPLATDAWFVVGTSLYGPTGVAQLVRSPGEFEQLYGPPDPSSLLADSVAAFFLEGGSRAYVSRVAPTGGAVATTTLNDADAAASLQVSASGSGTWGNELRTTVVEAGGGFTLEVAFRGIVERSPVLTTPADAAEWADDFSQLVTITATGTDRPAATADVALAGGTAGTYGDAGWAGALDAFTESLGPGQVSAPGRTDAAGLDPVLAHALAARRVALLDGPDTPSAASFVTLAGQLRTGGEQDRWGGLFAGWAVIPGLAGGTTRQVPWSAIQAGLYARNDAAGVSAAQPAAGQLYGRTRSVLGLTQRTFTPAERNALTLAGVNTARADRGIVESYGSRTLVDPDLQPEWRELAHARLLMAIGARADAIAENHLFAVLDGHGHEVAAFGGELRAMLTPYVADGSLYGDTPQDAFRVDVGPAVNTPETIAAGELRAVIGVRCSHMAEFVFINIVKVPTTLTV